MISVIRLVDLTVAAIVGILDLAWLALYGTKEYTTLLHIDPSQV